MPFPSNLAGSRYFSFGEVADPDTKFNVGIGRAASTPVRSVLTPSSFRVGPQKLAHSSCGLSIGGMPVTYSALVEKALRSTQQTPLDPVCHGSPPEQ
jgi:hypothetical protein